MRKGPPFHGSRSPRETKYQNASCQMGGREVIKLLLWGRAKGAAKASCRETVVQKGVFGESVSSLLPYKVFGTFQVF